MQEQPSTTHRTSYKPHTRLTVQGNRFRINDRVVDLYGIRVASASQSEAFTQALIENLNAYQAHGVKAITVFLQGSSGGFADPFSADGKTLAPDHLARIQRIAEACDRRGMVAIVGIFYQRVMADVNGSRRLRDAEAVRQAVQTTAETLQGYENVILNIANEQNSAYYQDVGFFDFNDPQRIVELCERVHAVDPTRLVGAGGYDDALNVAIGRHPAVDVLLFDTSGQDVARDQDSGWHHDLFVSRGVVDKPIVNVEVFGGWTKQCVTASGAGGHFLPEHKRLYVREVDAAAARPGLSVFFHANPWCQGPSIGQPLRFDLGGYGEAEDPGIRWWFEYVRSKIEKL
jgi:hypothetical protein